MDLILPQHRDQMIANYRNTGPDQAPVVKWFCPWGTATWLLTEMKDEDEDILFGLCDLGFQCPEVGYVSRSEVEAIKGPGGLKIERDRYFSPIATLTVYGRAARTASGIVTDDDALKAAFVILAFEARRERRRNYGRLLTEQEQEDFQKTFVTGR